MAAAANLVLAALFVFAPAWAGSADYEPFPGQSGKDVVWMPTEHAMAKKMLDLAGVTAGDTVYDLGSGDGRLVIAAAKRGARAFGVEYNPDLVALSRRLAVREGVAHRAIFIHGDIFETDFSRASVVTLFLLPDLNLRLRPAILNLKAGTRIVSNSFNMGEWVPDRTVALGPEEGCEGTHCRVHFWIVPARAEGRWKIPEGELTIRQEFQMISGYLRTGPGMLLITDGHVKGDQIHFRIGDARYSGQVVGDVITGAVRSGGKNRAWQAARVER